MNQLLYCKLICIYTNCENEHECSKELFIISKYMDKQSIIFLTRSKFIKRNVF